MKLSKMSSLPPDTIKSILIRLPVKSLLRFRCVSKPWCAEIDSPQFIQQHLTHSIKTGSNLSPIAQYHGTLYSFDTDSLEKLVKIKTPFINPQDNIEYSICNGLLLLQVDDNTLKFGVTLILFNPSTRKYHVLPTPPPPPPPINEDVDADLQTSNCLGYDIVNDDYKVFNILVFVDEAENFIACEARVYSLKSNKWHVVKDFATDFMLDRLLDAYVNGALHTLNNNDNRTIVALDVAKETFNFIPMPNRGVKNLSYTRVHVFNGCLAILCRYGDNRTDIWVMKEYGVMESWSMLLSVNPGIPCTDMIPMLYSKDRTEVLLSHNCELLVLYNLRKKTIRGFYTDLPFQFSPIVYAESLVSVGGTGKIDEKKKQKGEKKMQVEIVKSKRDDFLSKGFKLKL